MDTKEEVSFAVAVKRDRKKNGLTQEQLARKLDVTLGAVQGWEKGAMPRLEHYMALTELFKWPKVIFETDPTRVKVHGETLPWATPGLVILAPTG